MTKLHKVSETAKCHGFETQLEKLSWLFVNPCDRVDVIYIYFLYTGDQGEHHESGGSTGRGVDDGGVQTRLLRQHCHQGGD